MVAMRWCYSPHRKCDELLRGRCAMKCVLAVVKVGFLVGYLLEAARQGGAVLGVAWPLPSRTLKSNEHFRSHP